MSLKNDIAAFNLKHLGDHSVVGIRHIRTPRLVAALVATVRHDEHRNLDELYVKFEVISFKMNGKTWSSSYPACQQARYLGAEVTKDMTAEERELVLNHFHWSRYAHGFRLDIGVPLLSFRDNEAWLDVSSAKNLDEAAERVTQRLRLSATEARPFADTLTRIYQAFQPTYDKFSSNYYLGDNSRWSAFCESSEGKQALQAKQAATNEVFAAAQAAYGARWISEVNADLALVKTWGVVAA